MRTIHLHFTQAAAPKAVMALGYLATWAQDHYDVVDIWPDRGDDLVANYRKTGAMPPQTYTIGAIWREDEGRYSFHS